MNVAGLYHHSEGPLAFLKRRWSGLVDAVTDSSRFDRGRVDGIQAFGGHLPTRYSIVLNSVSILSVNVRIWLMDFSNCRT
jgi:hypothetical protein